MARRIATLESCLQQIALGVIPGTLTWSGRPESETRTTTKKVFIVHGHDIAARESVTNLVHRLGLNPIVLNEQADKGLTIIEKLEVHATETAFAVVILTPDDVDGTRARQNVVFEWGYFAAKLGRAKVCVLRKGTVEIPSDMHGLVHTDLDSANGWHLRLAKELKTAGLEVNLGGLF